MALEKQYDVVIIGAGLAGLSLARHLLLDTDKTVLLLERRGRTPVSKQKVGESQVQLAGHYFSRVLDLEEHLLRNHFMKYNLRFYWPSGGRDNRAFEDLGKAFIRPFSNIPSYQVDRNELERELLRLNRQSPRFAFQGNARITTVDLRDSGPHSVSFEPRKGEGANGTVTGGWVVDTTGRGKLLARRLDLHRENSIRHGAFFWWVDGLVDVERLTDLSRHGIRKKKERRQTGHLPTWMATNHFMGEGFWFWVIPLQGKTSLGLVYDSKLIPHDEVFSVDKATAWVSDRFPLFARDLPRRKVLDFGGYKSFSFDCDQTLSPQRWALTGEAGRFSDPLYSPGSDLIAIYNTLIVDAIEAPDDEQLLARCRAHEQLMKATYAAYVPSYTLSYDALGDQEVFCLKYTWELTVYFAFYVFPFINDLFTERRFGLAFTRSFGRLGPINEGIQQLLSDYFQWKKEHRQPPTDPLYFDFFELAPLQRAEKAFYEVGVTVDEAKRVLAAQLKNLENLARFTAAHVAAEVLGDERIRTRRTFVEGIDVARLRFDPVAWAKAWAACQENKESYDWSFDTTVMDRFRTAAPASLLKTAAGGLR